jgi:ribonuclease VapC
MIIDTAAMLVLIQGAPAAAEVVAHLTDSTGGTQIAAPAAAECLLTLNHLYGPLGRTLYERVRQEFGITTADFTESHAATALRASVEHGDAGMSYTDLMTYAVARDRGEPLLSTDPVFARTDLEFSGAKGTWQGEKP